MASGVKLRFNLILTHTCVGSHQKFPNVPSSHSLEWLHDTNLAFECAAYHFHAICCVRPSASAPGNSSHRIGDAHNSTVSIGRAQWQASVVGRGTADSHEHIRSSTSGNSCSWFGRACGIP